MSQRTDQDPHAGSTLGGRYRVERVLGRGGVGVVVVARDQRLKRLVAIKLLQDDRDPEAVARFLREANAAAQLASEHAVRVHDVGCLASGAPFMVMEYLQGADLHAAMRSVGTLPPAQAVDFCLQACEGIAEAHALGLVHRDIKPSNLFLARRANGAPLVKVVDFGLAKEVRSSDQKITATAMVIGSPEYMSPEQVRSDGNVDHRTDVWSLGVCLYELVTGRTPFAASSVAEVMANILTRTPMSAHDANPKVPLGLSDAIARSLAKVPDDRFATLWEMAAAIEPFGSPECAGASGRVGQILASPMLLAGGDADGGETLRLGPETQTAASVDTPAASGRRLRWLGWGGAAAIGAAALVAWGVGRALHAPSDVSATPSSPSTAAVAGVAPADRTTTSETVIPIAALPQALPLASSARPAAHLPAQRTPRSATALDAGRDAASEDPAARW